MPLGFGPGSPEEDTAALGWGSAERPARSPRPPSRVDALAQHQCSQVSVDHDCCAAPQQAHPTEAAVTRHLHSSAHKEPVRLQKDTRPWGW